MAFQPPVHKFALKQMSDQREQIRNQHAKAGNLISLEVAALAFIIPTVFEKNAKLLMPVENLSVSVVGMVLSILCLAVMLALRADERVWPVARQVVPKPGHDRPSAVYQGLDGKGIAVATQDLENFVLRTLDANDRILLWSSRLFVAAVYIMGASLAAISLHLIFTTLSFLWTVLSVITVGCFLLILSWLLRKGIINAASKGAWQQ